MNFITFQKVLQTSSTAQATVGNIAETPDGRKWVYVQDSGSGMSAGNVAIPAAVTSVAATIVTSANASGQNVYIKKASAGWTVGQFIGAYGLINAGTGTGQIFKVKSNTTDTLELEADYALGTATDGTSTMALWTNSLVRKAAVTSKVQNAVGIVQVDFTASYYGWALVKGLGKVVAGEVLEVGKGFVTGDDTAGQVVKATTAKGTYDEQGLGACVIANSAADVAALVYVNI